jgi:hypothetical protein
MLERRKVDMNIHDERIFTLTNKKDSPKPHAT